jgi:hypothetical protein
MFMVESTFVSAMFSWIWTLILKISSRVLYHFATASRQILRYLPWICRLISFIQHLRFLDEKSFWQIGLIHFSRHRDKNFAIKSFFFQTILTFCMFEYIVVCRHVVPGLQRMSKKLKKLFPWCSADSNDRTKVFKRNKDVDGPVL